MSVRLAHASISENNTIRGTAGDQTGKEVCIRTWYKHSKGWILLRCKDPKMRSYIAEGGEKAAKNDNIGYDQTQNQDLWDDVKNEGYDPSKADDPTETDCARLVRVCCQYACEKVGNGEKIPDFYTATEASVLVKTGLFEKLTASKYVTQDDYLMRGDILVTKTKGHTVIVLDDGDKAEASATSVTNTSYVGKGIGTATAKQAMNIRSGAGTSYSSYGVIKKGTKVEVLAKDDNGWLKIAYPDCEKGFAYTSNRNDVYYDFAENTSMISGAYVTTGKLNMRYGAGKENKVLTVIPKGKTVVCTGKYQDVSGTKWLQVTYNGMAGYCSSVYLEKK